MSKVFNMVGGGGGKNISSIIITGLESTDTVTCTKDGKSYPATWDATAQHWEIVGLPLGTFILAATNGTKTTTKTVLIDIAGVYEIEMDYTLWVYRNGDQCEDVSGGFETFNTDANGIISLTDSSIHFSVTNSQDYSLRVITNNKIDVSNYTHIKCEANVRTVVNSSYAQFEIRLGNGKPLNESDTIKKQTVRTVGSHTIDMDVSDISGEYYIGLNVFSVSDADAYKIWLE